MGEGTERGGEGFYTPPPVPAGADVEARRRAAELLSSIEYVLEPHVPEAYREEFKKYEMLISRTLAVSNIPRREDIYRYLDYFDVIILWLKFNKPEIAVKRMARLLMELQLLRSVGGFERVAEISTRQVVEQTPAGEKRRGFWARLMR